LSRSSLSREIDAFLIDRQARGLSPRTVEFYRQKLALFQEYLQECGVESVYDITSAILREFLVDASRRHTPGGTHAIYRAVRAFLLWWEGEEQPTGWANPLRRVRPPKVAIEPLEPASIPDIQAMLSTCKPKNPLWSSRQGDSVSLARYGVQGTGVC
jgi:site-specific recombinase XerD